MYTKNLQNEFILPITYFDFFKLFSADVALCIYCQDMNAIKPDTSVPILTEGKLRDGVRNPKRTRKAD